MTFAIPHPYEFVLLSLAAYRLVRLIGWDSITEPLRSRITGSGTKRYRPKLDEFIHCPYCTSFWTCVLGYLAWNSWPHAVTVIAVPWAASGVVGLISKNWDS